MWASLSASFAPSTSYVGVERLPITKLTLVSFFVCSLLHGSVQLVDHALWLYCLPEAHAQTIQICTLVSCHQHLFLGISNKYTAENG